MQILQLHKRRISIRFSLRFWKSYIKIIFMIMKSKGLSFKLSIMFAAITVETLILTFISSYVNQNHIYSKQREESIQYVADYLEKLIKLDDDDFLVFQDYFIEHYREYKIPRNFGLDEINESRELYETLFAQQYPGMVFGKDISFEEVSKEVKDAYAIWNYEYYRYTFEQAAPSFNIAYSYYLVPTGEPEHMYWFLDIGRDASEIYGEEWLALCLDIHDPVSSHPHMWEAWEKEIRPSGYDIYDDSYTYGSTYAYYTPLIINGNKLGVIGVEIEIAKYNHDIFIAALRQAFSIGVILIAVMILLLITIRSHYFKKLVFIKDKIQEYSITKNTQIAELLSKEVKNKDEISTIMGKLSDMIYELDLYMKNLSETKKHLRLTQQEAMEMSLLAMKDTLTGIRNKTGYDKEVLIIEEELNKGKIHVGAAVIDLNSLKKINDEQGHDNGNKAIIALCEIVRKTFKNSPVFRIGGDDFVVILKETDLYNVDTLCQTFRDTMKEQPFTAAIGYAIFDPFQDAHFENTFRRATEEMKKAKK